MRKGKTLLCSIIFIFLTGCATLIPTYVTPGFENTPLNRLAKISTEIDALTITFKIIEIDGQFIDWYAEKYVSPGKHILKFDVASTSLIGATGMHSYREDLRKLKFEIDAEPGEYYYVHLTSSDDERYHARIVFYNAKYKKWSLTGSTYPKDHVIKTVYIGKI